MILRLDIRVCVCMGIRRKSYDVLPATGPSWFPPLATMLKGREETAKRQGKERQGGTE